MHTRTISYLSLEGTQWISTDFGSIQEAFRRHDRREGGGHPGVGNGSSVAPFHGPGSFERAAFPVVPSKSPFVFGTRSAWRSR